MNPHHIDYMIGEAITSAGHIHVALSHLPPGASPNCWRPLLLALKRQLIIAEEGRQALEKIREAKEAMRPAASHPQGDQKEGGQ